MLCKNRVGKRITSISSALKIDQNYLKCLIVANHCSIKKITNEKKGKEPHNYKPSNTLTIVFTRAA